MYRWFSNEGSFIAYVKKRFKKMYPRQNLFVEILSIEEIKH